MGGRRGCRVGRQEKVVLQPAMRPFLAHRSVIMTSATHTGSTAATACAPQLPGPLVPTPPGHARPGLPVIGQAPCHVTVCPCPSTPLPVRHTLQFFLPVLRAKGTAASLAAYGCSAKGANFVDGDPFFNKKLALLPKAYGDSKHDKVTVCVPKPTAKPPPKVTTRSPTQYDQPRSVHGHSF